MSTSTLQVSVPPEILQIIFDNLIKTTIPEERPWTAVILTHVCRLFRQTALGSPRLWTSLGRKLGRPGLALIEACLERSKDQPLDVYLHAYGLTNEHSDVKYVKRVVVDSMAKTVLSSCSRWRNFFSHRIIVDPFDHWQNVVSLAQFHSLYTNCDAPMLEMFSFEEKTILTDIIAAYPLHHLFPRYSSWNLPKLHSLVLRSSHISKFPPEFRKCLRSISITYERRISHLKSLRTLAHVRTLESLHLNFYDCNFKRHSPDLLITELPNVKSLHLDFHFVSQTHPNKPGLWKTFCTLRFPNVVHLKFLLDEEDGSFMIHDGLRSYDITLFSLLGSSTHRIFPNVETLELEVRLRQGDGTGLAWLFPHCCLTTVKHLRIQCNFKLTLAETLGNLDNASLPEHLASESGGILVTAPIALQRLTLEVSALEGIVEWVRGILGVMHDQGSWHDFSELVLTDKDGDKQVLQRDEVERWCQCTGSFVPRVT